MECYLVVGDKTVQTEPCHSLMLNLYLIQIGGTISYIKKDEQLQALDHIHGYRKKDLKTDGNDHS